MLCIGTLLVVAATTSAASNVAMLRNTALDLDSSSDGKTTPVQRVVALLKEMESTLESEMADDEKASTKMSCWCKANMQEKEASISAAQSKISELQADIESQTAKSAELETTIEQTQTQVQAEQTSLASAAGIRKKEETDFHAKEAFSVQAIDNLKRALGVLTKQRGSALPQVSVSLLSVGGKGLRKDAPWFEDHESSSVRALDDFMTEQGFDTTQTNVLEKQHEQKFLQAPAAAAAATSQRKIMGGWTDDDLATVRLAVKSASKFVQTHHGETFLNTRGVQTDEFLGVLQQLKEEMEEDLANARSSEATKAQAFSELNAAKSAMIENSNAMIEQKKSQKSSVDMNVAEAKEDLDQTSTVLSEEQQFMAKMVVQCRENDEGFSARKKARLEETRAVGETISILTADAAKDAMSGTYAALVQVDARRSRQPALSVFATHSQVKKFDGVKKALQDMIDMQKKQQDEDVHKNDWCKQELHNNDMKTLKKHDLKADQEAKIDSLAETIKAIETRIEEANAEINSLVTSLQSASFDRKEENVDFQKTLQDQRMTVEVLNKAMDRLSKFYDTALVQAKSSDRAKYQPSKAAGGVMSMLEKLIQDAQQLIKDSQSSENAAQTAYVSTVEQTNSAVAALHKEVATKTNERAAADEEKLELESDLKATNEEILGLGNTKMNLRGECEWLMQNFEKRTAARQQEIEALQESMQLMQGAEVAE